MSYRKKKNYLLCHLFDRVNLVNLDHLFLLSHPQVLQIKNKTNSNHLKKLNIPSGPGIPFDPREPAGPTGPAGPYIYQLKKTHNIIFFLL